VDSPPELMPFTITGNLIPLPFQSFLCNHKKYMINFFNGAGYEEINYFLFPFNSDTFWANQKAGGCRTVLFR
jgi:hypothetical protein